MVRWVLVLFSMCAVSAYSWQIPQASEDVTETESDSVPVDTSAIDGESTVLPSIVDTAIRIPKLDFASVSLFEALTALGRAHNLSLFIDPSVTGSITMRLDNVTLNDALAFIIVEYDLDWQRTGEIIKIFKPIPPPPPPTPLDIIYSDTRLSVDLKYVELARFVDTLIDLTGRNIVLDNSAAGPLTGKLVDLPLDEGLRILMEANGFAVQTIDDILYIGMGQSPDGTGAVGKSLRVSCDDGLVSLDVSNSRLSDVISSIGRKCGISVFLQVVPEGSTTARFDRQDVESALTYLLLNTTYTFKEQSGIYFVGHRDAQDLQDSKLIRLKHLVASTVEPLIPAPLAQQVSVKVVKEHNGLLLTGARTSIARVEGFLDEIDIPTAQVLFEVVVVDFSTTDQTDFEFIANNFGANEGKPAESYYPGVDVNWNDDDADRFLRSLERRMDWSNLGKLPDDFYARLRWMEQQGVANVRSHPQLASLNGHPASLRIGTTQYYLLETQTIYPTQQTNISTQTAQRFETIEADLSLEITPYVNQTGELIVEIKPEFSTPVGQLDPDVPPTINRRLLNSTVRMKDGETIVLGGLIQTTQSESIDKVPILGSLPLIGRLFQNRHSVDRKTELMIYVTPHVYYGSEGSIEIDSVLNQL